MPGIARDAGSGTGHRLAGRYELGEPMGRGGMAEVRRAFDHQLGREVAVKLLHPHLATDAEARHRFQLEASAAASLNHPNAVTVYDTGESGSRPFIVMECLPGRTFADEMAAGPVAESRVREVALDVLGALEAAHDLGIVHRDVKPSNIMLAEDRAKVGDFGIARSLERSDLTLPGQVLGTPRYAPPERLRGEGSTPAGDLYSLGIVLYEALTGRRAFSGSSPLAVALTVTTTRPEPLSALVPDCDPALARAVERAMDPDPAARFPSARSMAAALAPGPATAVRHLWAGPTDDPTVALPRTAGGSELAPAPALRTAPDAEPAPVPVSGAVPAPDAEPAPVPVSGAVPAPDVTRADPVPEPEPEPEPEPVTMAVPATLAFVVPAVAPETQAVPAPVRPVLPDSGSPTGPARRLLVAAGIGTVVVLLGLAARSADGGLDVPATGRPTDSTVSVAPTTTSTTVAPGSASAGTTSAGGDPGKARGRGKDKD